MNDLFGDRMKAYEAVETERHLLPLLPVYARIDGRGFSRFTQGMTRPFDVRMTQAMVATTQHLVATTQALIGYTQSDEISLLWYNPDYNADMLFGRKIQKLVSVLAASATAAFQQAVRAEFSDWERWLARLPHFDTRVFQLPTCEEAANMLVWRNLDATKNAVSMAARAWFSHTSLHGMSSAAMQEKLFQDAGVNFNDYPEAFKRGVFVRRVVAPRCLDATERSRIAEAWRPAPDATFLRAQIEVLSVPPLAKVINRVGFLFNAEPARVAVPDSGIADADAGAGAAP